MSHKSLAILEADLEELEGKRRLAKLQLAQAKRSYDTGKKISLFIGLPMILVSALVPGIFEGRLWMAGILVLITAALLMLVNQRKARTGTENLEWYDEAIRVLQKEIDHLQAGG